MLDFEQCIKDAETAETPHIQVERLQQAIALYQSDLLLTCYDDWITPDNGEWQ